MSKILRQNSAHKGYVLPITAVTIGMFMVMLDSTAINVILPRLSETFNSPLSTVQWAVTAYTLALAAVIPLSGIVIQKFGEKRAFTTCVILFTFGSVLCSFAASASQLIIFRIIQGLGGGMIAPITIAFTYKISPPEKIGRIMAFIGVPALLAPSGAPILAGWLSDFISWKWVFLINLPIGLIAAAFGLKFLPKHSMSPGFKFDALGTILAPVAFAAFVYGVSAGGTSSSSISAIIGVVIGLIALAVFIPVELKRETPLFELKLFKTSNFRKAITTSWLFQFTQLGILFLATLFFQQAKGFSAFQASLATLASPVASATFMQIGGHLFDKRGIRPVAISGFGLVMIGAVLLAVFSRGSSLAMTIISLAIVGAGMGVCMMPLNTYVLQCAPRKFVDGVTSFSSATQQVVNSFATAGATSILVSRTSHYILLSSNTTATASSAYADTFSIFAIISVVVFLSGFRLRYLK